jgi:uncharacterized protein (TIGR03382 family)
MMNPEATLALVVVSGTAAAWCALVVLKAWVLRRRLPHAAGGWALVSAGLMIFVLAAAVPDYGVAEYILPEQNRVDEMHRRLTPALERYRQAHGMYPASLQKAGIETPMTNFGPLHYYGSDSKDDPWYLISFGDIERDRFSADWDSRWGTWSIVKLDF